MDQALLRSRSGGAVEPWLSHRAALSLAGPGGQGRLWRSQQKQPQAAPFQPGAPGSLSNPQPQRAPLCCLQVLLLQGGA